MSRCPDLVPGEIVEGAYVLSAEAARAEAQLVNDCIDRGSIPDGYRIDRLLIGDDAPEQLRGRVLVSICYPPKRDDASVLVAHLLIVDAPGSDALNIPLAALVALIDRNETAGGVVMFTADDMMSPRIRKLWATTAEGREAAKCLTRASSGIDAVNDGLRALLANVAHWPKIQPAADIAAWVCEYRVSSGGAQ